jgi:nitroimidazol reductase NimA-like FMN-containing flavoprotein (pyridoxamine 5'-phosphate oxidase superfamily)
MPIAPTERTRVRRLPARANYDRAFIDAVIDEALSCHVGFAIDGRPWVVPTIHARIDDYLYLHGAVANHMLGSLADGIEACVTITIIDGLVLARSAFHHSMNYRSVMVFGRATRVDDIQEKKIALRALVEHVVPGRSADAREPSPNELRTTLLLALPISEVSAKVRTGGPIDDEEDLDLPVWAGQVGLTTVFAEPVADSSDVALPDYVREYRRP